MKKLIIMVGLGWMLGLLNVHTADAQHVTTVIHINVDRQPAWGPVGYDYVEYYYIPELNIYFDVENELFYYQRGRRWIESPYLPARYARYDFYSLYKVVLNDVLDPWRYNRHHRRRYARYRYNYAQVPIFYVDDYRYEYARYNACAWVEPRYMENRSYYENVELRSNRSTESRISSGERSSRSESSRISSHRNSDTERYEERSSSGSNRSMRSSREISSGSDRGRSSGISSEGRRRSESDFSTNTRSRSERSSATSSSRSDRSTDWSTGNDRRRSSEASSENRRSRSGDDVSSSTRASSSRSSSDSSLDSRRSRSGDDSSSSMRSSRSESSVSNRSDEGSRSRSSESRSSESRSERSGSGGRR